MPYEHWKPPPPRTPAEQQRFEDERKAVIAHVDERQKQQQADAIAEQRRQTDRMRRQHREETQLLKQNWFSTFNRHWQAARGIDAAERQTLQEFDTRRGTWQGRAAEFLKGRQHFDARREDIVKRHEDDRAARRGDLAAVKQRHEESLRDTRRRQAQERKALFEKHRDERHELTKAQEADYDRQLGERLRVIAKAAELEQPRKQEREQDSELSR